MCCTCSVGTKVAGQARLEILAGQRKLHSAYRRTVESHGDVRIRRELVVVAGRVDRVRGNVAHLVLLELGLVFAMAG